MCVLFLLIKNEKILDTAIITILKVFHNTTMSTGCYVVPLSTICLTYNFCSILKLYHCDMECFPKFSLTTGSSGEVILVIVKLTFTKHWPSSRYCTCYLIKFPQPSEDY